MPIEKHESDRLRSPNVEGTGGSLEKLTKDLSNSQFKSGVDKSVEVVKNKKSISQKKKDLNSQLTKGKTVFHQYDGVGGREVDLTYIERQISSYKNKVSKAKTEKSLLNRQNKLDYWKSKKEEILSDTNS